MRLNALHIAGILLLGAQIGSIVYARFIPERFFTWAPYDQQTYYTISVELPDRTLSPSAIQNRYRYRPQAWEPRNINNVISIVRQYETTYGRNDSAHVLIVYETNGRPAEVWEWPVQ